MASIAERDPDGIAAELRDRRRLLEQSAETYLALADRLDDEIAALEAAQRLAAPAEDVDFEQLLNRAERSAGER